MSFVSYQPDYISCETGQQIPKNINIHDVCDVKNGTVFISDDFNETGVYDENGWFCPESVLLRDTDELPKTFHKNIGRVKFINEPVLYLGHCYLMAHFGHFLVEGMARTWALLYKKYKNIKVVVAYENQHPMPRFIRTFLNALGVADENIIVIYKPTKFSHVFIPAQAMNCKCYIAPIMNRVIDTALVKLVDKKYKTYDKIYLSRSAIVNGHGCVSGERQIEKIFEKNGYKVIYPEQLTFNEQVTLAYNCTEMAGLAGSALHLALFMKKDGRVIQIKRNSDDTDNIYIQKQICDVRGLDLVWIFGSIEKTKTNHYTDVPQIVGPTEYLIRFFDDNNFKYSASDVAIDMTEIQKYEHQLRNYRRRRIYNKIIGIPVRLISLFGITKHGRKVVREYLCKKLFV